MPGPSPAAVSSRTTRPRPFALLGSLSLLAVAILTPAGDTARWIVEGSAVSFEESRLGVLLWKLATASLGLLWLAADLLRPAVAEAPPMFQRRGAEFSCPASWMGPAALCLCAVGLGLRLVELDAGLWFDEIDTLVRFADGRLGHAIGTFETQNNHLAYSVLANLSVASLGASPWALRLPAVCLGAASLWALWRFSLRVVPPAQALFAVALCALSSHHVWFSQDARGYTGMLFATLASSGAFLCMLEARSAGSLRPALVYGFAAAFGVWMHPTAVFVVVAHFAIWLSLLPRRRGSLANRWPPLWGFVLAGLLSFWGYALVLPQMLRALSAPSMAGFETEWRNPLWLLREVASGLSAGVPGGSAALAAGGFVLALGLLAVARRGLALLALFVLPALVTAAVVLAQGHNLWPRFFFFSAGFGVLLLVQGIAAAVELLPGSLPPRRRAALLSAAALVLCLGSLFLLPRSWGPKQDFEGAADFVDRGAPAGRVATLEMGNLPFLDYLGKPWTRLEDLEALQRFEAGREETWIVVATPAYLASVQPRTWEYLQENYVQERAFHGTLRGGEILVKVRRANVRER